MAKNFDGQGCLVKVGEQVVASDDTVGTIKAVRGGKAVVIWLAGKETTEPLEMLYCVRGLSPDYRREHGL